MTADDRVMKSYVWHDGKCFFVSTIERDSSAMEGPRRFNETIVWDYDWDTKERGLIVHQDEGSVGSIRTHLQVCERFFIQGAYETRD